MVATSGLTLSPWSRNAAYSLRRTISMSAAMKGVISRVAIDSAKATVAAVTLAIQKIDVRLRFHASAEAVHTNAPSTAALSTAVNTLKLSVSSHSMGARIRAEVQA